MNRLWMRVLVRIGLLSIALAMVFWTMHFMNHPENVEKNSFFQIFTGPTR